MRFMVIIFVIVNFVGAFDLQKIKEAYESGNYKAVCTDKVAEFYTKWHDEGLTNMYAHSCLNLDMLNRLIFPIVQLHKTPESRANAAYYATVLTQKKLLYLALVDGIDISYIKLPKTNYILSNIFDKFVKKEYTKENNTLVFKEKDDIVYKLSLTEPENDGTIKMSLSTFKGGKTIKTRLYW